MAEIAVHTPLGVVPKNYILITIEVPKPVRIKLLNPKRLPDNWREFQFTQSTQLLGDEFIKAEKFAVLQVPSAVVQGDFNFLINPRHKDFSKIKWKSAEPFSFDERLFRVTD